MTDNHDPEAPGPDAEDDLVWTGQLSRGHFDRLSGIFSPWRCVHKLPEGTTDVEFRDYLLNEWRRRQ